MKRVIIYGFLLFLAACSSKGKKPKFILGDDTLSTGTIQISVDETFEPIIDSQLKVFMSQHPQAKIIAHYKPEAECMKDLLNDSIRMVIVTRGLSEQEVEYYTDTLQFPPIYGRIASDAVAVITNNKAKDSLSPCRISGEC